MELQLAPSATTAESKINVLKVKPGEKEQFSNYVPAEVEFFLSQIFPEKMKNAYEVGEKRRQEYRAALVKESKGLEQPTGLVTLKQFELYAANDGKKYGDSPDFMIYVYNVANKNADTLWANFNKLNIRGIKAQFPTLEKDLKKALNLPTHLFEDVMFIYVSEKKEIVPVSIDGFKKCLLQLRPLFFKAKVAETETMGEKPEPEKQPTKGPKLVPLELFVSHMENKNKKYGKSRDFVFYIYRVKTKFGNMLMKNFLDLGMRGVTYPFSKLSSDLKTRLNLPDKLPEDGVFIYVDPYVKIISMDSEAFRKCLANSVNIDELRECFSKLSGLFPIKE